MNPPNTDGISFRSVPEFPGYFVGDDGSVWSFRSTWKKLGSRFAQGYASVALYRTGCKGKQSHFRVARLVLTAFVGPCPEGLESCHCDGNRLNNRLDNLRWDTRQANIVDRDRHGATARGIRNGRSKLDEKKVMAIYTDFLNGMPKLRIAKKYDVPRPTVQCICKGQTWSALTGAVCADRC